MNASSGRWKFTTRSALTLTVVAVNALGFAVWLVLAEALNAGDTSGVYGMSYAVAGALSLPVLVVVLAVDVVSLVWAIHAAVTKARSPFSRLVLLALVPWAAALAMLRH